MSASAVEERRARRRPRPFADALPTGAIVLDRARKAGRACRRTGPSAGPPYSCGVNDSIRRALTRSGVVDITTTGRRTGQPRRVEIVYHVIGGRIYISGVPRAGRKRAWLYNLEANPRFTFHLKRGVTADLPATARVISDETERRAILKHVARAWRRTDVETTVAYSPLIEAAIEGLDGPE